MNVDVFFALIDVRDKLEPPVTQDQILTRHSRQVRSIHHMFADTVWLASRSVETIHAGVMSMNLETLDFSLFRVFGRHNRQLIETTNQFGRIKF